MSATAGPVASQPMQYITTTQPAVQYVTTAQPAVQYVQQPMMYAAAPQVTYAAPPATYMQPQVQYVYDGQTGMAEQPSYQYVTDQQQVQYVDEQGNPIELVGPDGQPVQYVDEYGQPVQFVDEYGQPVQYDYGMPGMQYAPQPAVYNVPPEIFAKLAQGISLTQAEMDSMTGTATVQAPAVGAPDAESFVELPGGGAPAPAEALAEEKKASKKSSKKTSKKASKKGCC